MISPAFFVASMVGFHVEFSHSMYSSKWPYSTPISCTRVTGPSVYWRSSWARALSGSEEAARQMDRIIGLIIFYAPVVMHLYSANTRIKPNLSRVFRYFYAKQKITPIHYYHDYSSVEARFCYSSRKRLGSGRQLSSLLGFAELQDELVRVSANRLVEHFGRAGVRRIGENRTLGVELEARGFDLSAHGRGLDAMQGLGYICGRAQSGGMIENYIYATGLQRTVDGLVKRGDVDRAHELVV